MSGTSLVTSFRAGIHPKIVSERLGHASVAFTLETYSHVLEGMDQAAASEIAAHILGPVKSEHEASSPLGEVPPTAEELTGDNGTAQASQRTHRT